MSEPRFVRWLRDRRRVAASAGLLALVGSGAGVAATGEAGASAPVAPPTAEAQRLDRLEARIEALEARLASPSGRAEGPAAREFQVRYDDLRAREQRAAARADSLLASVPSAAPLEGGRITSSYTERRYHPVVRAVLPHWGLDIAAPMAAPVFAMAEGVVAQAFRSDTYGIGLDVSHGVDARFITRYAHLSRLAVVRGERVRKGQLIGYVGMTGRTTGPHLHLELYERTAQGHHSRDPIQFLPPDGQITF